MNKTCITSDLCHSLWKNIWRIPFAVISKLYSSLRWSWYFLKKKNSTILVSDIEVIAYWSHFYETEWNFVGALNLDIKADNQHVTLSVVKVIFKILKVCITGSVLDRATQHWYIYSFSNNLAVTDYRSLSIS